MATGAVAVATDVGGVSRADRAGRDRAHRAARRVRTRSPPPCSGVLARARRWRRGSRSRRAPDRGRVRGRGDGAPDGGVYDELAARAARSWRRRRPDRRCASPTSFRPIRRSPSQPFVVNEMIEVQEAGHERRRAAALRGAGATRCGTGRSRASGRRRPAAGAGRPARRSGSRSRRCCATRGGVLRTLAGLHRGAGANPGRTRGSLAVTPKALAAAWRLRRLGVEHVHAHFANQTADCAAIAGGVAGIPFSFTAHAYDIYSQRARASGTTTLAWKLAHAARAFAVSDFARELLRARLPAERRARVRRRTSASRSTLFRAEPPPRRPTASSGCCASRASSEKKGLDTLLDACGAAARSRRALPPDALRRRAAASGAGGADRAARPRGRASTSAGPIPQEEVARAHARGHCFVMPCRQDRHRRHGRHPDRLHGGDGDRPAGRELCRVRRSGAGARRRDRSARAAGRSGGARRRHRAAGR